MTVRDYEYQIKTTIDYIKANLNTKIEAINGEKGDYPINRLNDDAYFFKATAPDITALTEYIIFTNRFELFDSPSPAAGGELFTEITLVSVDGVRGMSNNAYYKMLRYARAIVNTVLAGWEVLGSYGNLNIRGIDYSTVNKEAGTITQAVKVTISTELG
jgi:hypothetical protein